MPFAMYAFRISVAADDTFAWLRARGEKSGEQVTEVFGRLDVTWRGKRVRSAERSAVIRVQAYTVDGGSEIHFEVRTASAVPDAVLKDYLGPLRRSFTAVSPLIRPYRFDRWITEEVARRIEEMRRQSVTQAADEMNPSQFEEAVARSLRRQGFSAEVIGGRGDLGRDVVGVDPRGHRFIAQCKRYKRDSRVSSQEMQLFVGMVGHHRATRALYATTSSYTKDAADLARANDIELYDADNLDELFYDGTLLPEPSPQLAGVLEAEVRAELLNGIFEGRIASVEGLDVAFLSVRLDDGREVRMSEMSLHDEYDLRPVGAEQLAALIGSRVRVKIVGTFNDGMPLANRLVAAKMERYDDQLDALDTLHPDDLVTVRIDWLADDDSAASGRLTKYPDLEAILLREDTAPHVYRMREFVAIGREIEARIVSVARKDLYVGISLLESEELPSSHGLVEPEAVLSYAPTREGDNASAAPDLAQLLGDLGRLRDAGVLTEDEFLAKQSVLLSESSRPRHPILPEPTQEPFEDSEGLL